MDETEAIYRLQEMSGDMNTLDDREALSMAIEALDKQRMDPVHPNYGCPNCGADLICECHLSDFKYCPNCGKRLGWKEDYD